MFSCLAVVSCWDDFDALVTAMSAPQHESKYSTVRRVYLFDGKFPKRYELPPETNKLLDEALVFNTKKLAAHILESTESAVFFINAEDVFHELYPNYIESFFQYNRDKCSVVYVPVVDYEAAPLPEEFESLPQYGLFALEEHGLPEGVRGAAILLKDLKESIIDSAEVLETFNDSIACIANAKGRYGKLNTVSVFKYKDMLFAHTSNSLNAFDSRKIYSCLVSIIVPAYNASLYLDRCLSSILNQSIDKNDMEIILVDDGSIDDTWKLCCRYANEYHNISAFTKNNGGVSSARNYGMSKARGRYLMFVDSDDTLHIETVRSVTTFMSEYENEVDLVTYKENYYKNGVIQQSHYRYDFLTETGVYDLAKFPYIAQTRINICIKNFGNTIQFDEKLSFQEDQLFCSSVISNKMKIGFVKDGEYQYQLGFDENLVSLQFSSVKLFEPCTALFEFIFSSYKGSVPSYFQALFVSDLSWKLRSNVLFPYHYSEVEFNRAICRLQSMLKRIDAEIILNFPKMDNFHKHFWLSMKDKTSVEPILTSHIKLTLNGNIIYRREAMEIIFSRFDIRKGRIDVIGWVKCPVFNYVDDVPHVLAVNDEYKVTKLNTWISADSCYKSRTKTNNFYSFRYTDRITDCLNLTFYIQLRNNFYSTTSYFYSTCCLGNSRASYNIIQDGYSIRYSPPKFVISKVGREIELSIMKSLSYRCSHNSQITDLRNFTINCRAMIKCWLYFDMDHVGVDNAYYQFLHDFNINDGVARYYITSNESVIETFPSPFSKGLVIRNSIEHKRLYLVAEKILLAYLGDGTSSPFSRNEESMLKDLFRFEVIYLQHGILHASMPSNYAADWNKFHRIVVSSEFEINNFVKKYNFMHDDLIPVGMARYDIIRRDSSPLNKILFAPSWRSYFATQEQNGKWTMKKSVFTNSDYFKNISAFLNSIDLSTLLIEYDYFLDVKLHPITSDMNSYFLQNERISIVDEVNIEEYKIFITDFSSFVFDFVFLKRAILYFVPDWDEFKCGINTYRDIDLPFESAFGELVKNPEDAIGALKLILQNKCTPHETYIGRMENFFLPGENHRKRLYDALSGGTK